MSDSSQKHPLTTRKAIEVENRELIFHLKAIDGLASKVLAMLPCGVDQDLVENLELTVSWSRTAVKLLQINYWGELEDAEGIVRCAVLDACLYANRSFTKARAGLDESQWQKLSPLMIDIAATVIHITSHLRTRVALYEQLRLTESYDARKTGGSHV